MSLMWVAVGFFAAGVLVGVTLEDAYELLRDSYRKKGTTMTEAETTSRNRALTVALVVVVAVQLAVGILLVKVRLDAQDSASCLVRYNQQFAAAYDVRVKASAEAQLALDEIVRAVAASDRDGLREAVSEYVQQRDKVKATQVTKPYPAFPSDDCGQTR